MKIIGYLVIFFFLCYLFFFWQFPFDHLKGSMTETFSESSPVKLMVGKIKPRVPFALLLEKNHMQSDFFKIPLPDILLTPNLLSLLIGRVDFSLKSSGTIQTVQAIYRQERNLAKMEVWLKKFIVTALFPDNFSVTAELSGEGTLQWNGRDYSNGEGQGWLLIHRGELPKSKISSLPFLLTVFNKMEIDFQLKQGILFVKRIEMTGPNQQKIVQQNLQIPLKGGGQIPDLSVFFQFPMK